MIVIVIYTVVVYIKRDLSQVLFVAVKVISVEGFIIFQIFLPCFRRDRLG